jgi:Ca2+-binding EF-hand superfamily protein
VARFARRVEKVAVWSDRCDGASPGLPDSASLASSMFPRSRDSRLRREGGRVRAVASSSVALAMYPDVVDTAPRQVRVDLGLLERSTGNSDAPLARSPSPTVSEGARNAVAEMDLGAFVERVERDGGETGRDAASTTPNAPASFRLKLSVGDLRRSCVMGRLHRLPHGQRARCAEYFAAHAVRREDADPCDREELYLPAKDARHAVMDLGYYETASEMRRLLARELPPGARDGLTLERFVRLVGRVAMADLTPKQVAVYDKVFTQFADPATSTLDAFALARLFHTASNRRMDQKRLHGLVREWGDPATGRLSYESFLSLIAYSLKQQELREGVEREFRRFADLTDAPPRVTPESLREGLRRAVPGAEPTLAEAGEMVYEADKSGNGWVGLEDFRDLVSVVYRPAWILLWDWRRRAPRHIAYDQFVDGEFDGIDEDDDGAA